MSGFRRRFATIVFLWAAGPVAAAGQKADLKPKVDALVQPLLESETAVGLAIGLVDGGKTHTFGYGKVSAASGKTPDERTVFEIGSVTKTFTSLALADMVRRKLVALDDPVGKWLPPSVKMPQRGDRPITLADLATHTSGLPRLPRNLIPQITRNPDNPYAAYTVQQLYEALPTCPLENAPGARYAYSNLGAGLLGHVLARRDGVGYEELIKTRICRPLGMEETQIALSGPLEARFAQGHNIDGIPVAAWDIPTLAGAGALRSTVHDMLLWVSANLGLRPSPLAEAIETTHVPRHDASFAPQRIALGWHFNPKIAVHWHNGQTGGFHSYVAFHKERKIGVVVLSNTATGTVDRLGDQILVLLLGKPVEPLKLRKPARLEPGVLDRYVGQFELLPGQVFSVTREGDRLMVQLTGQPGLRVVAESETEFFYRVVDARITFVKDDDGKFNKLILHQHGLALPAYRGGMAVSLGKWFLKTLRGDSVGAAKTTPPGRAAKGDGPRDPSR